MKQAEEKHPESVEFEMSIPKELTRREVYIYSGYLSEDGGGIKGEEGGRVRVYAAAMMLSGSKTQRFGVTPECVTSTTTN